LRLACGCNSYDWGKIGKTSAAAKYAAATEANKFEIKDDKPYAELWMGTHPSLPSKDVASGQSLLEIVRNDKGLLNPAIAEKFGDKLPFLFKVLSINKALSIQAHPNKKLAEQLHARDSKNYPDDNHKPEMTIAVTHFDGLCGFRPLAELSHFLKNVSSLRELVGESKASEFEKTIEGGDESKFKNALQTAFTALMKNEKSAIESAAKKLVSAAETEGSSFAGGGVSATSGKELADLVVRLNKEFPGDVGLFVLFFLNYVKLEIGEAMFLKADDIHAYLSGDIIECMASSDNVVRAGFTPKFKDVDVLTDMLTYSYAPISEQKMDPAEYPYVKLDRAAYSSNSAAILYDPPIQEFSVVRTELKASGAKATFDAIAGPSVIICTKGSGKVTVGSKSEEVKEGYVFFVGAGAEIVLESAGTDFTTFKAFCELEGKEDAGK